MFRRRDGKHRGQNQSRPRQNSKPGLRHTAVETFTKLESK